MKFPKIIADKLDPLSLARLLGTRLVAIAFLENVLVELTRASELPPDLRATVRNLIEDEFNGTWPGSVARGKANVFVENAAGDAVAVFYDPGLWEIVDWEIVGELKELDEMTREQMH